LYTVLLNQLHYCSCFHSVCTLLLKVVCGVRLSSISLCLLFTLVFICYFLARLELQFNSTCLELEAIICVCYTPSIIFSKYGAPSYHISKWHLIEHSPSIVHAPTLCIRVHQTTPHKDIQLQTTLNDFLMNIPAFFKCKDAGTCIQHPRKSHKVWLQTFLLHFFQIVPVPSAIADIAHVPISWWSK